MRPMCVVTNDHWWNGSSVCSACGARLRCLCGRFVREDHFDEHMDRCPTIQAMDREDAS